MLASGWCKILKTGFWSCSVIFVGLAQPATGLITSSAPLEGLASLLQVPWERFQHTPSQCGEPGSLSAEAVCHHGRREPRRLRHGKPRKLLSQTFSYSWQVSLIPRVPLPGAGRGLAWGFPGQTHAPPPTPGDRPLSSGAWPKGLQFCVFKVSPLLL